MRDCIRISKKGFFFTLIGLFMIILFVSMIHSTKSTKYTTKSIVIANRLQTLNNFISDVEKDLEREMFIGGFRTFLSLHNHIRETEGFLTDMDSTFFEVFINGSINSTPISLMEQEGIGADFNSWMDRINEEATKFSVSVAAAPSNMELFHVTPWTVRLSLNVTFNFTDTRELAKWTISKNYIYDFPIEGFEDPIYTVYTEGKITYIVNNSRFSQFVDEDNVTTNLTLTLNNSLYTASDTAPSYLMRFVGNLSDSLLGIESFVNLEQLNTQNIPVRNKTLIDYIYFNDSNMPDDWCIIQNMPDWFRIDKSHASEYDVDDLDKKDC